MALMEMNDHVDGIEALRAANAGGFPMQYPLGMNGMGASVYAHDRNFDKFKQQWQDLVKNNYDKITRKDIDDATIAMNNDDAGGLEIVVNRIKGVTPAGTPGSQGPQGTAQTIVDAIKQLLPALAPLTQKRPKVKNIIQKEPDYTTYAVIGGAVIVASVLAIAIGKSGARRRRD